MHPAPSWMVALQGELRKDPRALQASSPSLASLLESPKPLHITLGTSGTQQSDLEAVSSLQHYTCDVKKLTQSDFCQFAGQQLSVGIVLGTLCCGLSSSSGCDVPHPSHFRPLSCCEPFRLHITPFVCSVTFDNLATITFTCF